MVNYGVIEEKMCDLCMGEYITYGIGAYNTQAHELITFVSDVFPCKDDAEKFVNVCNEKALNKLNFVRCFFIAIHFERCYT